MNIPTATLDADELLHLAIASSAQNKHDETIAFLKRAIELDPKNGKAYYLLGATHAQIGMYDRAAEEIAKAVALEPAMHAAHFQLGLLHITAGRLSEATKAWEVLDTLGHDHPLYLFKSGLLHLARDEFDLCLELLRKGIAANTTNPSLNSDMQKVIDAVQKTVAEQKEARPLTEAGEKPRGAQHILLSAYRRDSDEGGSKH